MTDLWGLNGKANKTQRCELPSPKPSSAKSWDLVALNTKSLFPGQPWQVWTGPKNFNTV